MASADVKQVPEELFVARACGQHPNLIAICRQALKELDEVRVAVAAPAAQNTQSAQVDGQSAQEALHDKLNAIGQEMSSLLVALIPELQGHSEANLVGVTLGGAMRARASTFVAQPVVVKLIMDPLDIDCKQRTMVKLSLSKQAQEKIFETLYKFYPGRAAPLAGDSDSKNGSSSGQAAATPEVTSSVTAVKPMSWAARIAASKQDAAPAPAPALAPARASVATAAATATVAPVQDVVEEKKETHLKSADFADDEDDDRTDLERWSTDPQLAFEEGLWSALSLWDLFVLAQDNGWIAGGLAAAEDKLLGLYNDILDLVDKGTRGKMDEGKVRRMLDDFVNYDLGIVLEPQDMNVQTLSNLIGHMQVDCFKNKNFDGVQKLVQRMEQRTKKLGAALGAVHEDDDEEEEEEEEEEEDEENSSDHAVNDSAASANAAHAAHSSGSSTQPAAQAQEEDEWETVGSKKNRGRKGKGNKKNT